MPKFRLLALPVLLTVAALASPSARALTGRPEDGLIRNWGIDNSESASHIDARKAWAITEGSRSIVVAVIDTGIDPTDPELKQNLWSKPGSADEYGWDFVNERKNPGDENGHGSHVSGIIAAALGKGHGAAGVAPHVRIMPIRYYGEGLSGPQIMSNIARSIDYAVDHGAQVINISSEGTGFNNGEYRAIKRAGDKGVLVVVAAGNQGVSNDTSSSPSYPASYDLPNIIAVAATNIHNELIPVSNFGTSRVQVAAPGENIFSTLPHGRYGYLTGTSQATAFVSGVAALVLSENPKLSPSQVRDIISRSVDKFPGLTAKVSSGGRVNAYKAVQLTLAEKVKDGAVKRSAASYSLTQ